MSNTLEANSSRFQNRVNIHLYSLVLPKNIVSEKDEVRVSITTLPEEKKECFTFEGSKMYNSHHILSLIVTNETRKILIVFRKKTIFSINPIIASTAFLLKDFSHVPQEQITNGTVSSEAKKIFIYYPYQQQMKEEKKGNIERRVIGEMHIQLTFYSPLHIQMQQKHNKISKVQHSTKNDKKNCYAKLIEENNYDNSFLL